MANDDDGEEDAVGPIPPPAPDDRLWRHPSEVSSFGQARVPTPVAVVPEPTGRGAAWPIALVAGFVGAAVCGGVLALTGNLSVDPEQVLERVKVTPNVPHPGLTDGENVDALMDRVSPSVVRLLVATPGEGDSKACGVVLRDDGVVVTSAHEVAGATTITVVLADGRRLAGELVGADLPTDVGVIRITAGELTPATLGSSEDLHAGVAALAIGTTPQGEPAVSTGVVSALGQRLDVEGGSLHGLIQTDAPIEAAWSGGPLVDGTGAVIGITTDLAGERPGFGFATPIELVRRLAEELLVTGKVAHGWLGIEGKDLGDAKADAMGVPGGADVRRVMAGSPADRGGLAAGDVITEVGGKAVGSSSDLVVALRWHKPGESVVVGYWRGGKHHETKVTIAHHPQG